MKVVAPRHRVGRAPTAVDIADGVKPISEGTARVSFGAASTFLALLAALHVLKPEFSPSWRFVSEYAIGPYGWVMMLAFLSLAVSCLCGFVAIQSQVETTGGKIGLALLLAAAAALAIAGIFAMDPTTASKDQLTTHGRLHGFASMIGIPALPIAAVLISRSLARTPAWAARRQSLLWTAHLTWISLVAMFGTLGIMLPRHQGQFGPEVPIGWPNRLLVVAYSAWLMLLARRAAQLARSQRRGPSRSGLVSPSSDVDSASESGVPGAVLDA